MKHRPWLAALWIMGFAITAVATDPAAPAAEGTPAVAAERASPQATLRTFLEAFYEEPVDLARAAGCLDLRNLPSEIRGIKGRELAAELKDVLDRTLSYRWSCHMAVCGSCGMMINGEPTLSCKAFLRDLPDRIRIEPLANFPIERDLVVVMDDFLDKLGSVKPYLVPREEKTVEDGEYRQTPAQLNKFKQYTLCINCTLCYAA